MKVVFTQLTLILLFAQIAAAQSKDLTHPRQTPTASTVDLNKLLPKADFSSSVKTNVQATLQSVTPGDRAGGGGVGYTCDKGKSVYMVDSYEAKKKGRPISLKPRPATYQEKVTDAIDRLAKVAPARAQIYKTEFAEMLKDNVEWSNDSLFNESDFSDIEIPAGCQPQQVAFQRDSDSVGLGQKRYVIQVKSFKKMNEDEKAVLILHELVYRDLLEGSKPSGTHARVVTETLFSANLTEIEYRREMGHQLFAMNEWKGVLGRPMSPQVFTDPDVFYNAESEKEGDKTGFQHIAYSPDGELLGIMDRMIPMEWVEATPCPKIFRNHLINRFIYNAFNKNSAGTYAVQRCEVDFDKYGTILGAPTEAADLGFKFYPGDGPGNSFSSQQFIVRSNDRGEIFVTFEKMAVNEVVQFEDIKFESAAEGHEGINLEFGFDTHQKVFSLVIGTPMKAGKFVLKSGLLLRNQSIGRLCFAHAYPVEGSENLCPADGTCL